MKYEKIIHDFKEIRFASTKTLKMIENCLYSSRCQEIKNEIQALNSNVTALSEVDNALIQEQLEAYTTQISLLEEEELTISELLSQDDSELTEEFIPEFAKAFRNIQHLHQFLSNAPEAIRNFETPIIIELLKNLSQQELQIQIEDLPNNTLKDLIENFVKTYNESSTDHELHHKAQNVTHLALMVLIKRECLKLEPQPKNPAQEYVSLLDRLTALIPEVGSSTIIDNINDSQIQLDLGNPNITLTIAQILYELRSVIGLNDLAWNDEQQLDILLHNRHLFQKLRFGQEDRRTYAELCQQGLKSDLFMVRNIADRQQFLDETAALVFELIEESNFTHRVKSKIADDNKPETAAVGFKRFLQDFNEYAKNSSPKKKARSNASKTTESKKVTSDSKFKLYLGASKTNILFEDPYLLYNLEQMFSSNSTSEETCPEPFISIDENGILFVKFNVFDIVKMEKDIKKHRNDSNSNIETKVNEFLRGRKEDHHFFQSYLYTGSNLREIEKNINEDKENLKDRTLLQEKLKIARERITANIQPAMKAIEATGFGDPQEDTTLRALLELYHFKKELNPESIAPDAFLELNNVFENIEQGLYRVAIEEPNIVALYTKAYKQISQLSERIIPESCRKTHDKSIQISKTSEQRQQLSTELDTAFQLPSPGQRKNAITAIFTKEYRSDLAKQTLGKEQSPKAIESIQTMAQDFVDFSEKAKSGRSTIDSNQEQTYQNAIAQIAHAISGHGATLGDLDKVSFKLSHKIIPNQNNNITITGINGNSINVPICINNPLPYSLIKTQKSNDFILSYGGSRGAVAELEDTEKERYFTNYRVRAGQYGTVSVGEYFSTCLGVAIKKGLIAQPGQASTYNERYRQNPLYRAMTSRDDPNSGTERLVLEAIAAEKQKRDPSAMSQSEYWESPDKPKKMHTQDTSPIEYKMLQPLAKGKSYKDELDNYLSDKNKNNVLFHRPPERSSLISDLNNTVALSNAIVHKAIEYRILGFSHNDIKPENFMSFSRPDGSYVVEFIDWATGGFKRKDTIKTNLADKEFERLFRYEKNTRVKVTSLDTKEVYLTGSKGQFMHVTVKNEDEEIEQELKSEPKEFISETKEFIVESEQNNKDVPSELKNEASEAKAIVTSKQTDEEDEEIEQEEIEQEPKSEPEEKKGNIYLNPGEALTYGINPVLEIVAGALNCTLPYISPKVVLERTIGKHTYLKADDFRMDDWALTAVIFGICNRSAYFKLSEGRAVNDYTIPGIIGTDGKSLTIENRDKFNEFFSPEESDRLSNVTDINTEAVMYIPSTRREGQPLHMYQKLKKLLAEKNLQPELKLRIETILTRVHLSIKSGEGIPAGQLVVFLCDANQCIQAHAHQHQYQQALNKNTLLEKILIKCESNERLEDHLLSISADPPGEKNIEILCSYPDSQATKTRAVKILERIDSKWLKTHILSEQAPLSALLRVAIDNQQSEILEVLIAKLSIDPDANALALIQLITDQALLHYVFQQNMTKSAQTIIKALRQAGMENSDIWKQMCIRHFPNEQCPYIIWNADLLHAAIRNKNFEQLKLVLGFLPKETEGAPRETLCQALFFSAEMLNPVFFAYLQRTYNAQYSKNPIHTEDILSIHREHETACPFHSFLREPETTETIPWNDLKNLAMPVESGDTRLQSTQSAIKAFLNQAPYPCMLAAKNQNYSGLFHLLDLAKQDSLLTAQELDAVIQQTDSQGANLLNYVLGSQNLEIINPFIDKITPSPLYPLLQNPAPNNPLINFLQSSSLPNAQKFDLLKRILAQLDPNQHHSLIILIANHAWLIQQANDGSCQELLDGLLASTWLSFPAKLTLLERLLSETKDSSNAKTYFEKKRAEFTATPSSHSRREVLELSSQDFWEIQCQENGLPAMLRSLKPATGNRSEPRMGQYQSHIDELNAENLGLKRNIQASEEQIREHASLKLKLKQELTAIEEQLAIASREIEEQIRGLQEEKDRLLDDITTHQQSLSEILNTQMALSRKLEAAKKEKSLDETMIQELEENNDRLLKALEENLGIIPEYQQAIVECIDKLEQNENLLGMQNAELETFKQRYSSFFHENQALKETQNMADAEISALNLSVQNLRQEISALNSDLSVESEQAILFKAELEEKVTEYEFKREEISIELEKQKELVQLLTSRFDSEKLRSEKLSAQVDELQNKSQSLEHALQEKFKQVDALKGKLGMANFEKNAVNKENSDLRKNLTKFLSQIKQQTTELEVFKAELSRLSGREQSLLLTNQKLSSQFNELTGHLETILQEAVIKESEIESQLYSFTTRISNLESSLASVSQNLAKTQNHAAQLESKLQSNQQQLFEESAKNSHNTNTIQELEKQNNSLTKKLSDSQLELLTIQEQISTLELKNNELIAASTDENKTLKLRLELIQATLLGKNAELAVMTAQIDEETTKSEKLSQAYDNDVSSLKESIESLKQDLTIAQEALLSEESKARSIFKDLNAISEELTKNKAHQSQLSSELESQKEQNESLNTAFSKEKEILFYELESSLEIIAKLKNHIGWLQANNDQLFYDNSSLLNENQELHQKSLALSENISKSMNKSSLLQQIIQEQIAENSNLTEEIAHNKQRISELETRCSELQSTFTEQLANSRSVHDLDNLQTQLRDLRTHVEALQRENSLLRTQNSSKSIPPSAQNFTTSTGAAHGERLESADDESNYDDGDDESLYSESNKNFEVSRNRKNDSKSQFNYYSPKKISKDSDSESLRVRKNGSPYSVSTDHEDISGISSPREPYDYRNDTIARAILNGPRTIEDIEADLKTIISSRTDEFETKIYGKKPDPIDSEAQDQRFVRLSRKSDDGKLLDAGLESNDNVKVTVYRRFTQSSSPNIEEKAKIILKSMGIPPEAGFDLPTTLIINGETNIDDLRKKLTGKHAQQSLKIIASMFEQYEQAKNHELLNGRMKSP